MKDTINQIKNSPEGFTNRLDCREYTTLALEDRTSGLKDRLYYDLEYTEGNKREKIIGHDQNTKDIWDNIKRPNLRITGIEENMEIKT